jgi:DNA-binding GntR family transcriptional regulator
MTVQSAFRVLKDEGLISSQQGRGSFVRSEKLTSSESEATPGEQDALTRIEAALNRLEERVAALEAERHQ